MIRAFVIWFIGAITAPIIVVVCDWAAPQFITLGWSTGEVALTINALKFIYPILFLIMGVVVMVRQRRQDNTEV